VEKKMNTANSSMIDLKNVTKTYQMGDSTVRALDGVTMTIERGEFVAITGPSGSGKSTLMNILGCLDRPTDGSYRLDGDEVATLNDDQLAVTRNRKIGFVFQNFNLLPRISAIKNIALPLVYAGTNDAERMQQALVMLEKVGIAERKDHRPNELSGGQRQRVAIARALVTDPAILIADEPTGNLDTKSSNEIMDIFCGLHRQGRTIIMVTHEADIAAYAQRVIHVRDGKILGR
jgi:putative ABC transport system ATP-binding protein